MADYLRIDGFDGGHYSYSVHTGWVDEHGVEVWAETIFLLEQIADRNDHIDRLRAAGDALAEAATLGNISSNWVMWAVAAWEEARRD